MINIAIEDYALNYTSDTNAVYIITYFLSVCIREKYH